MTDELRDHLERTLRAFVRLVNKLGEVENHMVFYNPRGEEVPTPWKEELAQARDCLREAKAMATPAQAAGAESSLATPGDPSPVEHGEGTGTAGPPDGETTGLSE